MGAQETTMEPRPKPRSRRGTCFAWEPSWNHLKGSMLDGTGPLSCLLLVAVLLSIPVLAEAGIGHARKE